MSNQLPAGWVEVSRWCIRSADSLYTICKIGLGDNEYRYELWKGNEQLSVGMSTAQDAIRLHTSIMGTLPAAGAKSSQSPAGAQAELL